MSRVRHVFIEGDSSSGVSSGIENSVMAAGGRGHDLSGGHGR